ncbi:MAG: hypothetical protein ACHQM6_02760, partial [Candidatus Kapaibacterium sp.]
MKYPKDILLRKVFPFGILIFFFVAHGKSLYAQPFPERNWWIPGSISTLPSTDSLHHRDSVSILGLDFQHALSLYTWSSSMQIFSNSLRTLAALMPSFSFSSE